MERSEYRDSGAPNLNGRVLAVFALLIAIGLFVVAGIGLYMLSLRIQAHRTAAERLDGQVVTARQQVRQLQEELEFRSRYTQLARWGDTLGLQPAGLDQRTSDPRQIGMLAVKQHYDLLPPQNRVRIDDAGHASYPTQARQQMDSLIADVGR